MAGLDLGTLFMGITVDDKGAIQQLGDFKQEVNKTGEESKSMIEKMNKASKSIGDFGDKAIKMGGSLSAKVTAPILAMGGASFKFAADLEDAMGATEQIFKGSSDDVKSWADSLESYYGIAESDALEYANTMGAMLQNIGGLSEAEASKQSATLIELAGDLTAMFGGTTESAVNALTGALKGNNSMLDNYGMGVNEATIKTKALEMGLIKEGESLDLAGKQSATLALIMEQTADAQGQASREAEGASGTMRGMGTEIKNLATDLGGILMPMLMPFIQSLKDMVGKFKEMSPSMQENIVKIALLAAAVGPVLLVVGKLASVISGAITMFTSVATAISGAGGAMALLLNPITLIVGAIVGLIAIFTTLYATNDEFRANVNETWEQIKETISAFVEVVQELVSAFLDLLALFWEEWGDVIMTYITLLWDLISGIFDTALTAITDIFNVFAKVFQGDWEGAWEAVKQLFSNLWDNIKELAQTYIDGVKDIITQVLDKIKENWEKAWNNIKTFLSDTWDNIKQSVKDKAEEVKNSVIDMKDKMIEVLKNLPADAFQIGKDFVQGVIDGIGNMVGSLVDKAKGLADSAINAVKNTLKIQSPSRVMVEMGEYTTEGFADGIEQEIGLVDKAIARLTGFTTDNFNIPINAPRGNGNTGQGTSTSTTNNNTVAPQIHIHVGSVRNDGDIKNIGRELQKEMTQFNRTLGVV